MTYVKGSFPRFIAADFNRLLELYGFASSPDHLGSLYDTLGDGGPTAVKQSEFATGYPNPARTAPGCYDSRKIQGKRFPCCICRGE